MRIFLLSIQIIYFSTFYGFSTSCNRIFKRNLIETQNDLKQPCTRTGSGDLSTAILNDRDCNSELSLVQILFRHGDRAPIFAFPTNAYYDIESIWSVGTGELTKKGMQQHYELGKYFRERYKDFLNKNYTRNAVHVLSSDVDRCIISAQSFLAGLVSEIGEKECYLLGGFKIPMIPVHTIPKENDNLLHFRRKCNAYLIELFHVTDGLNKEFTCSDKELLNHLSQSTGADISSWSDVYRLHDTLFIQDLYNLSLPEWTKSVYGKDKNTLKDLSEKIAYITVSNKRLRQLRGGPLLKLMLHRIHLRQNGINDRTKMYLYSGHESTIVALQASLGIFQHHIPPYASSLIIEFHSVNPSCGRVSKDFIKVYYKNDSNLEPYEIKVPACGDPCFISYFENNHNKHFVDNWNAHCENNDSILNFHKWFS